MSAFPAESAAGPDHESSKKPSRTAGAAPSTDPSTDSSLAAGPELTHEPGLPPPENHLFYPALDGLRAAAVLLVFWEHYFTAYFPSLNWGWTGVDIFFVLSGFLITGILFDTRDAPHRLRNFYMRRTLRIFPLYYGVLLAALLTTPIFHWFWNWAWALWPLYLGNYVRFLAIFVHSPLLEMRNHISALEHLRGQPFDHTHVLLLGHFWSLSVEEQFYLLWPAVVFSLRRRTRLLKLCLLSIPVVLALRLLCVRFVPATYLHAELLYRLTPLRVDALLIGGAAALAIRGPERATVLRLARPALALAFAGFVVLELIYRHHAGIFYQPSAGSRMLTTIGYTFVDLSAAALILNLLTLSSPLARIFNLAPLRALGRISYGFYVFHDIFHPAITEFVTFHVTSPAHPHNLTNIGVVAFCLTLVLAILSYHLYEKPLLRLKVHFSR